jgi:hypothetical protein
LLALAVLALVAACDGETPADDGRAASGEVLEGTISDAMLPVDRVRSEAPLADPEAFAEVRSEAEEGEPEAAEAEEGAEGEEQAADDPAPEATPAAEDE